MRMKLNQDTRATALLELVDGNATQGIIAALASYGYTQGAESAEYWLGDAQDGAGLLFNPEWTEVLVLGNSLENLENLNYILNRSGWDSASALVSNLDVEENILTAFASVTITAIERSWERESDALTQPVADQAPLPAPAVSQPAPSAIAPMGTPATPNVAPASSPAPIAPPQPAAVDNATTRQMQEKLDRLQREVEQLRASDQGRLLRILEGLLMAQLQNSLRDSSLAQQLADAGYVVSLQLLPKQSA